MIRNFKYLGRRTIERKYISIGITGENEARSATVSLDLTQLRLPPNAPVFMEAYRLSTYRRFDLGTVATLTTQTALRLFGFNPDDIVLFRVKVLDPDANVPRLLAEADRLTAATPATGNVGRVTILQTTVLDLGDEIWQLDLSDDFPMLLLNSRIPAIKQRARSGDDFIPLVFPHVVRALLQQAKDLGTESDDDSVTWPALWVKWGEATSQQPFPNNDDEQSEWVDAVVAAFCKRVNTVQRYRRIN